MSKPYVITLVHGTFAQDGRAQWTSAESTLVRTLKECLGENITIRLFNWDGKNTHASRHSAGKSLAKQLKEQSDREPNATHVVIAHSHGGNILAYALSQVSFPDLIVVTLGTPFIRVNSRLASDDLWFYILIPFALLAISGLLLSFNVFEMAKFYSHNDGFLSVSAKAWADISIVFPSITLAAIAIVIGIFAAREKIGAFEKAIKAREAEIKSRLEASFPAGQRALFVSVAGDEARFGLGVVDRLGNFPAVCVDFLFKLQKLWGWWLPWKFVASIMMIVLTPIILLFSIIRLAGYWDDRVFDYPWIRINVSAAPNIRWPQPNVDGSFDRVKEIKVIRVRYGRGRWFPLLSKGALHHSGIYERADVLRDVAGWIKTGSKPAGCRSFFRLPEADDVDVDEVPQTPQPPLEVLRDVAGWVKTGSKPAGWRSFFRLPEADDVDVDEVPQPPLDDLGPINPRGYGIDQSPDL